MFSSLCKCLHLHKNYCTLTGDTKESAIIIWKNTFYQLVNISSFFFFVCPHICFFCNSSPWDHLSICNWIKKAWMSKINKNPTNTVTATKASCHPSQANNADLKGALSVRSKLLEHILGFICVSIRQASLCVNRCKNWEKLSVFTLFLLPHFNDSLRVTFKPKKPI